MDREGMKGGGRGGEGRRERRIVLSFSKRRVIIKSR